MIERSDMAVKARRLAFRLYNSKEKSCLYEALRNITDYKKDDDIQEDIETLWEYINELEEKVEEFEGECNGLTMQKTNWNSEKFLNTDDIAEQLCVTTKTVRCWIDSGLIPAYKFGKKYRVLESDFLTFLKNSKVERVN